jgi:NAD+ synthase
MKGKFMKIYNTLSEKAESVGKKAERVMKNIEIVNHIVKWLEDFSIKSQTSGFVVGVSGGIDSALVSTLCAKSGKKVIAISMPMYMYGEINPAHANLKWLSNHFSNVAIKEIDLTDSFQEFFYNTIKPYIFLENTELVMANAMSRFRMMTLYAIANYQNMLVVGTGNKIEDFGVGFFTKYGDGGVDISPIGDLMKSEVRELSKHLNILPDIINAAPSDGLWEDGRTDEEVFGATYDELEWAMNYDKKIMDSKLSDAITYCSTKRQKEVLAIYYKRHNGNQHKMLPIPICEIPERLK